MPTLLILEQHRSKLGQRRKSKGKRVCITLYFPVKEILFNVTVSKEQNFQLYKSANRTKNKNKAKKWKNVENN